MKSFEARWWRLPGWFYYSVGVLTAIIALGLRYELSETYQDYQGIYLFATIPVALAAFLGGLGPGLAAAIIGLIGTKLFLIEPKFSFGFNTLEDRIDFAGYGVVWLFICVICDFMRRSILRQFHQQERIDAILGSITDGFFSVDREWKVTHVNDAFLKFVDAPRGKVIGTYVWQLLSDPAFYEARVKLQDSMRSGHPIMVDTRQPGADRWVNIRGFPMPDGMFVYVQDATDRKRLEESQSKAIETERQARSEAEAMSRMKDEFVATLSHELRTPLTTILGWTEVLRREPELKPKQSEGLAVIEKSVRHQTQLIGDLLDMSRIATGKLKLELEFVNLADTAYEAVELARPAADAKNIHVDVDILGEDTIVRGDAQRLYQVLSNLLSNAIKFTPRGGKVHVEVYNADSSVHCAVTDTGEGIDPAFLPYLFDRFRQGDSSATRRHGGLGLGLSIVRQLVELHGGTVQAISEGKGRGSRFEFQLPIAVMPATMLFDRAPKDGEVPSLEGLKILAVDDDEGTQHLLEQVLADAGADVVIANSGPEALDELEGRRFDVILSDIGMPDMDGYQFLRAARAKYQKEGLQLPPAVALTAFAHEKDFVLSAEAGFVQHLTKPVDINRLIRTLHSVAAAHSNLSGP